MDGKRGHITLKNPQKPGEAPKEFTFDAIYDWKYVPVFITTQQVDDFCHDSKH
jgi:hypothetical protein